MRFVTGFARFWYDFIIGDAWEIAAGIVVVLAAAAALLATHRVAEGIVPLLTAAGIILVVGGSILAEARRGVAAR
jgi:hypothetical protein